MRPCVSYWRRQRLRRCVGAGWQAAAAGFPGSRLRVLVNICVPILDKRIILGFVAVRSGIAALPEVCGAI